MTNPSKNKIKAVILAGGKGTRLKPLTAVFPKPLVPLGNKPIIEILLRKIHSHGLIDVTICTGHLEELIMAVCGDGSQFGLNINYSKEDSPLGTAGPLGNVKDLTNPIMVMNGDLLTTLNFNNMLAFHAEQKADITVGVYQRDVKIDFGVIESNEDKQFVGLREKPTYNFEVSMGVNVIGLSAMEHIKPNQYLDMPDLFTKVHDSGGRVCCYREDCYWLDIGRMDDYALAQDQYAKNEEQFLGLRS
ncbi:MAG: NTP transferase domain-containing protein [Planctomycetota bacterium]|nr:MAG: NTP transferase domain-containing protein [Planctomycetota bacterium]